MCGTKFLAGLIMRWDLEDVSNFSANITNNGMFSDISFWNSGRRSITGDFEARNHILTKLNYGYSTNFHRHEADVPVGFTFAICRR